MTPLLPSRLAFLACVLAFTALPVLAAPAEAFLESASVKVRAEKPGALPESPPTLVGARNEFVSFQVILNGGDTGLKQVFATLDPLQGPSEIRDITLFRETYLDITQSSGGFGEKGRWPDGLVPDHDEVLGEARRAFPIDVPANESRAIWVDVLIPSDAPPGDYASSVELMGEDYQASLPLSLRVVNATMPSTSSFESAYILWDSVMCRAHRGGNCTDAADRDALVTRYQQLALDHRITLSNIFASGFESPTALKDWAKFDALYGPFLDGTSAQRLEGARMTSAQFTGPRTAESLRDWWDHFQARGWAERLYDYTGDEPPYGISFAEARTRAANVREGVPEFPTLLTTTVDAAKGEGLESTIDKLVVLVNFMDGTEAPYEGPQRAKYDRWLSESPRRELWLYQSCMSHGCAYGTNVAENRVDAGWPSYMVDRSAAKNRAMQWLVFLEGATGELYYGTNLALTTAWSDQFQFNGNGDGTLFYPGTPDRIGGTRDVPLPSIRLKLIRQGMQDFEWLKWVSEAGDHAFAQEHARRLIPSASRVGDDGRAFDEARLALIARYEALQPEGAADPTAPPTVEPRPAADQEIAQEDPVALEDAPVPEALGCAAGGSGAGSFASVALMLLAGWWFGGRVVRSSRWNDRGSAS